MHYRSLGDNISTGDQFNYHS